MAAESEEQIERERRERVEAVAVRQHESTNSRRILVDDELRHRPAGVVTDEHDIAQIERGLDVEHDLGDTAWLQVSVRIHRRGMGGERPGRGEHAKATLAESLGHIGPQRVVDEESVDEHDWSPVLRAGDPIVDRAGGKVDALSFSDSWCRQGKASALSRTRCR